jgi:excisionase family DNA binding protein
MALTAKDLSDQVVADVLDGAPPLMTYAEAAKRLGRAERTVRSDVARGLIKVVRVAGGYPRIARVELARLIREGMR